MKIHEVPEGERASTLCCGMFPSFLRSGDLLTEHTEIVTCDNRVPRCPGCKGEAGYIGMRTEPSEFAIGGRSVIVMKVDPCVHEFRVRIGTDSKIRLEKWTGE